MLAAVLAGGPEAVPETVPEAAPEVGQEDQKVDEMPLGLTPLANEFSTLYVEAGHSDWADNANVPGKF